ncbi:MAG TPA: RsmG family class I SAM-dependent methyltransferase [Trueperaceae bacterium]|nr:RsmG family class I SAM-dependent methyltransferase [Trueperaceae bacterium]
MSETAIAIADARLKAYTELLVRYNGSLNLLSAQGLRDIQRLLADGKGYARVIEDLAGPSPTVVDVGSGAGFPGIVISAMLPQARVILVERRRRRAAFLELAVGSIGLENTTVFSGDVRRLQGVCAHVVTAQAVTTLSDLTGLTRHLHRDVCFLISRRGPGWRADLDAVEAALDGGSRRSVVTAPLPDPTVAADAESNTAVAVVAEKDLDQSGSLVALRLTGGPACRSSG